MLYFPGSTSNSLLFLFQAGLFLLCTAFAIFGISEVPEGGVQFDATHFEDSNFNNAAPAASPIVPDAPYVPPQPATQEESYVHVQQDSPAVDLLDDVERGSNKVNDSTINELD